MQRIHLFTLALALAAHASAAVQIAPPPVQIAPLAGQLGPEAAALTLADASEEAESDDDAPLAASVATGEREVTGESAGAPAEPTSGGDDDRSTDSQLRLELEMSSALSSRGEGAVDAVAHLRRGPLSAALGAGSGGGEQASARTWMRASLGWDFGVALAATALWQPAQLGAYQEQLELRASREGEAHSWELTIAQIDAQLSPAAAGFSRAAQAGPPLQLSGASAALDFERALASGLRATARAGGGLYALSLPRSAALPWSSLSAWERLGNRALAWPSRAEGALGLESGSAEGELTVSAERTLGRATLSMSLCAAHLWPNDLWLGSLTFGVRWRFSPGGSNLR